MKREIKREDLIEFLSRVSSLLKSKNRTFNILAFGGSALTLYGFKGFTKDMDLLIENLEDSDIGLVRKTKKIAKEEFDTKLDLELGHQIVWWNLLDDYWEQAEEEKTGFSNINLRKLSVYDIIISKCARYSTDDRKDIISILENKQVDKEFLKQRFDAMIKNYRGYSSQKKSISENFSQVLKLIEEYGKRY